MVPDRDASSRISFVSLLIMTLGWFTSLLVGSIVGVGLITSAFSFSFFPTMVNHILGWFTVISTLFASILWFFDNG
jgi:hypothetical protein